MGSDIGLYVYGGELRQVMVVYGDEPIHVMVMYGDGPIQAMVCMVMKKYRWILICIYLDSYLHLECFVDERGEGVCVAVVNTLIFYI